MRIIYLFQRREYPVASSAGRITAQRTSSEVSAKLDKGNTPLFRGWGGLFFVICVFLVIFFLLSDFVLAYVMSSPNYRIQSDSINVGGAREGSSNYRMEDTIGEIASGESASASYKLKAGYQMMQGYTISISAPADVTLSPNIAGVTGGTATGQATWTIITDNPTGYSLTILASTSPALATGAYNFTDYTPSTAGTPDYTWSVAANASEFGFTPEGADIVQKYKDNGSVCSVGTNDNLDKCWYNFSTSSENIASATSNNDPAGTNTAVKFKAESGSSRFQTEGSYQATITATALTI